MKKYDIYAVGNAFVDLQFAVSDDVLKKLGCEKGGASLIDEEMENKLNFLLKEQTAKKFCGGSGANTLVALHHEGGKGFYSCNIGSDAEGKLYHQDLRQHHIESIFDLQQPRHDITGRCYILLTPDAERTLFTLVGASERISAAELYEPALLDSKGIFIEGFLFFSAHSKPLVGIAYEMARKHKVKTIFTLSTCPYSPQLKKELLATLHAGVDLLFCNEDEAKYFCGTENIKEILDELSQFAKQFVITRGKEGALLYDGNACSTIPSIPTDVIDTTGAGDAFAGGFLYGYCRAYSFKEAGQLATATAAKVISKFGPRV